MKCWRGLAGFALGLALVASACGRQQTPSDQDTSRKALPSAEVVLHLQPPEDTPEETEIALIILDMLSGPPYNPQSFPMTPLEDGRWQAVTIQPVGSLMHYRFSRLSPGAAEETSPSGEPIVGRVAYIQGPTTLDDLAAGWTDSPYSGQTGRIVGRLHDATSQDPIPEAIVTVAGLTTFTDGEGAFRIEDLAPGLHNLVVYHPHGAFLPAQQGAMIAPISTTLVELDLQPATPVTVTLEVTVPENTVSGAPIRVAGNLRQLGNAFGELPGGVTTDVTRMPTLAMADPTHYTMVAGMYAGTDLRYRYTLGDGLWNAERDGQGLPVTRQVIIPDHDLLLQDTVTTWQSTGRGSLTFQVEVPENTPPTDLIYLQFKPYSWLQPLPMWRTGEQAWAYTLHGPLDFEGSLGYRYCRNMQCGSADDADTPGEDAAGHQVTPNANIQNLLDQVSAWHWWEESPPSATIVAPEQIPAREVFETGVELLPAQPLARSPSLSQALAEIASIGATTVTLTPTWVWERQNPLPVLSFDPTQAPFAEELSEVVREARDHGLRVAIHLTTQPSQATLQAWWQEAERDADWWQVWFEEYRSFVLTLAGQATQAGAAKLILGGVDVAPALPDGLLPDGTPSQVPGDAEDRWRELISEVRQRFHGRLAFEVELGTQLQPIPAFLDAVDDVHLYWHAPLAEDPEAEIAQMQAAVATLLDQTVLSDPVLQDMPLILSLEYLSLDGGAGACPPLPEDECRPASDFDLGANPDPELTLDLHEQAKAINAVLLEISARPEVLGIYVRRYNATVALHDMSASVNGKPARDVLWYWYPRLMGALQE
ncbi:MAG: hypothetical protein PVJ07_02675 [Anaerolineales bacterium]|jgi:hypothetical protein